MSEHYRQLALLESERLTLESSIALSLASLTEYGRRYRHWVVAYSGGKDSSATVALTAWAIKAGLVPRPASLTVLYADTRQEYPVLYNTAMLLLDHLRRDGFEAKVVLPAIDDRFYVYMLGYGVPPPNNYRFRWCTRKLKVDPMTQALERKRQAAGEKYLLINGVRLGESAVRDQRIALSCSRDSGECGQGWFEVKPPESAGDTLAPLLHWRLCHVFDWVYFEDRRHGYPEIARIAEVYGDDDVRTGCIQCYLVNRDVPLERLIRKPRWEHLRPLLELRGLFDELRAPGSRLRKYGVGNSREGQLGPLTMDARAYGLERVLDIQGRAGVDLINAEEEARIRGLWDQDAWPRDWAGDEPAGDVPLDKLITSEDGLIVQPLLVR